MNKHTQATIITFINTEDALAYGREHKGNEAIYNHLKGLRAFHLARVKNLIEEGKEAEAFYLASGQSQLVREALEAMEGLANMGTVELGPYNLPKGNKITLIDEEKTHKIEFPKHFKR